MDEEKNDNAEGTQGPLQLETPSEVTKTEEESENLKLITHGFTEDGWLIFKIHESHGYHAVCGFIMTTLVNIVTMYFSNKAQQNKAGLVRPSGPIMKPGRFGKFFGK